MTGWRIGSGRTLDLDAPRLMAVLNVTPDSFSDGGCFDGPDAAVERGLELAEHGATVIDIGGESSRPGAAPRHAAVDPPSRRPARGPCTARSLR